MIKNETVKVFVYGTLKRGMCNHERMGLKKAKFICKANLSGFDMYSMMFYPIIVPNGNKTKKVVGEIYEISKINYLKIKGMELASGFKEIKIKYNNNEKLHCFIYQKIPFNAELIEEREWKKQNEDSSFNEIKLDTETIKEKEVFFSGGKYSGKYYRNDYFDYPYEEYSDYDTDNDVYDLLIDFPHLLHDLEIQEYVNKSTRLKRLISNDKKLSVIQAEIDLNKDINYKMTDSELNELDEFWEKYVNEKTHEKPDYELDEHFYCGCRMVDIKPTWVWDSVTRVWRCQKCGEFQ
jgi:gamma-glutamylcyclotransferase (GGCT)/AIG2-like uncharacterized protein YtfP